jgi:hypothetical protein
MQYVEFPLHKPAPPPHSLYGGFATGNLLVHQFGFEARTLSAIRLDHTVEERERELESQQVIVSNKTSDRLVPRDFSVRVL